MRKNVLTIMVLLISGTILAQNGGTFMKKYENQLPQSGYRVWATFPLMKPMAANYGLENEPVIEKMQTLLENIVIKSASVY